MQRQLVEVVIGGDTFFQIFFALDQRGRVDDDHVEFFVFFTQSLQYVEGIARCDADALIHVVELRVAAGDLGKVIGRQGRTARAIRTILAASGTKLKKRFVLEILE